MSHGLDRFIATGQVANPNEAITAVGDDDVADGLQQKFLVIVLT